jgi:hypothetical protein
MRSNSVEKDRCDAPSRSAANGERSRVGAERERVEGPGYAPRIESDIGVAGQCRSNLALRACIEEGNVAVGAAHGESAAVVAERLVEDAVASLADDSDRIRCPQQRGQEVAAGRVRVEKVRAFSGEKQRSVEARIDERLSTESLRHGCGRVASSLSPFLQSKCG